MRHEHIDRRYHEQREGGPDDHSAYEDDSNAVPRPGPGARREHERKMAYHGGCGRHEYRPKPRAGRVDDGPKFFHPRLLELVRKLHDEYPVFRYESDQRNES